MIVLLHRSTFRAVLNVALSSPKGYQMSLRLPWVNSLSPHVEPGYRRMVGAVLLVTVHAKRVMPVSTGRQIVSLPIVTNHGHIYREAKGGEGRGGYITPAAWGDPHRFRAGDKIRGGPQVGKVAT